MPSRTHTRLIVVHVSATDPKSALTVKRLRQMHKDRGFSDIGYNEWIDQNAELQQGRGLYAQGAHVRGYNSVAFGIMLEGGLHQNDTTPWMLNALEKRIRELLRLFPEAKVCGHRDLSPDANGNGIIEPHEHVKLCPRFDVIPWARSRGLPVADIKGVWDEYGKAGPDDRTRWLQKLLAGSGYPVGPTDGVLGHRTATAIELFQKDYSLPQSGEFDAATVARLRAVAEGEDISAPVSKPVLEVVKDADKEPLKSKTNWLTLLLGSMGTIGTFLRDLNPIVQGVLIVGAIGIAGFMIWERSRKSRLARSARADL